MIAECGKARTSNLWHPFVVPVGHDMQQFRNSIAPYRCDDAGLGKVSPDRINHRGLLADEQVACAVKHQAALLLRRPRGTNRMLALATASQMASASAMSFF